MGKGRLEAFSDGVIAIVITIMVLELRIPHGHEFKDLLPLAPIFGAHVLSFTFLGIYWTNHHHLFHAVERVNGSILWANLYLLFWLSLIPFMTGWIGETGFEKLPVALYGAVLLLSATGYKILVRLLVGHHGKDSKIARAIGRDIKGNISLAIYASAIVTALFAPVPAYLLYVVVALLWIIPDRRIERLFT